MESIVVRTRSLQAWAKDAGKYFWHLLFLIVFWTVVPAFAKLGDLNGVQKTFWIDWFAVGGMLVLIPLVRKYGRDAKVYTKIGLGDVVKMCALGFIWPFLYQVAFFEAIYEGSPALTTIIGRASLLVYAPILVYIMRIKERLNFRDVVMMVVSVGAVLIALSGGINWIEVTGFSILLAVGGAMFSGIYIAFAEKWERYDPLVMTFVIQVAAAIYATIWVIASNSFVIPTGDTLFYLLVIGVLAGSIAFWLWLAGFQIAVGMNSTSHKVIFLVFQSGVLTFAQVVFVVLMGAEIVTPALWIGTIALVSGLIWYSLAKKDER